MSKKTTALIIMDGFGITDKTKGNAELAAGTPNLDRLRSEYPYVQIGASGMDVGLPAGQMGNSEVGHLNIGAGRVVYQKLTLITKSIMDGGFYKKKSFIDMMQQVNENGGRLHIMGLLSDGGVHSHIEHLFAVLRLAKQQGIKEAYVHCFMDGRDVPPSSGEKYIGELEDFIAKEGYGKIATVEGRYYAMDRDNRWDRVEKAYNAVALGKGNTAKSAMDAVREAYGRGETDEFITPCVVEENGRPIATVENGDGVFFYNFRPDRAREITRCFIDNNFTGFEREKKNVVFLGLTQYDETFTGIITGYTQEELHISLENNLGEYVSKMGKTQVRIAETEKYAHVTFFFNGGVEKCNEGEDRVLVPSPKVATYDLKPEMSAYEVCDKAVEAIRSGKYDLLIMNYANCDMVGHTGVMEAAEKAVRTVDECVARVVDEILAAGGNAIVTADHGNAEQMVYCDSDIPFTAHTTNPVPFILVDPARKNVHLRKDGKLGNIAPTLCELMGLPVPKEMDCGSMIVK